MGILRVLPLVKQQTLLPQLCKLWVCSAQTALPLWMAWQLQKSLSLWAVWAWTITAFISDCMHTKAALVPKAFTTKSMESSTCPFRWPVAFTNLSNPQPWSDTPRMIWTFHSDLKPLRPAPPDQSATFPFMSWNVKKVVLPAGSTPLLAWHASPVTCLTTEPKSASRPLFATRVVIPALKTPPQPNAHLVQRTLLH